MKRIYIFAINKLVYEKVRYICSLNNKVVKKSSLVNLMTWDAISNVLLSEKNLSLGNISFISNFAYNEDKCCFFLYLVILII